MKGQTFAVAWLALHGFAAMIASPVIVVLLVGIAKGILGNSPLKFIVERGGFANPLVWGPGLVLGLVVNRRTRNPLACWVWLIAVAWLAYGILDSLRGYDPRFYQGCSARENVVNAFFVLNAYRCGGGSSTLEGLIFTTPAVCSAAYSVGAWIALRLNSVKGESTLPSPFTKYDRPS